MAVGAVLSQIRLEQLARDEARLSNARTRRDKRLLKRRLASAGAAAACATALEEVRVKSSPGPAAIRELVLATDAGTTATFGSEDVTVTATARRTTRRNAS